MSTGPSDPVADLFAAVDALLGNEKGLVFLAADPARRPKLEADLKLIRAQLQPMRVMVAKLERVDRMVTKALKRVKPGMLA